MKAIKATVQTIDMTSGQVTGTKTVPMQILPPHRDACQVCGRRPAHAPDQPHDAQSLYYQYAFHADHDRWPTWKDAVAHCAPEVQTLWERELRKAGAWPKDDAAVQS